MQLRQSRISTLGLRGDAEGGLCWECGEKQVGPGHSLLQATTAGSLTGMVQAQISDCGFRLLIHWERVSELRAPAPVLALAGKCGPGFGALAQPNASSHRCP